MLYECVVCDDDGRRGGGGGQDDDQKRYALERLLRRCASR